ncbi:MAG TPA: type VI secretion system lipoprotein TssJ [Nannocystaceae bacterium]|nr:type VI secretion system lipoprotein TssJ [Nannocystaceae bacterium]
MSGIGHAHRRPTVSARRILHVATIGISLAALGASGCRAKATCAPGAATPLMLRLRADPRSNPSPQGNPLTTEIRVYQLAAARSFEESSYEELLEGAEARLGEDLVAASVAAEYLYPGGEITATIEREEKARFVAVTAFVREPIGRSWRLLVPLPTNDSCRDGKPVGSTLEVQLRGSRLSGGIVVAEPGGEGKRRQKQRR